jgi:hypothetical protein
MACHLSSDLFCLIPCSSLLQAGGASHVASLALDAGARRLAVATSDGACVFDARAPAAPLLRLSAPLRTPFSAIALDDAAGAVVALTAAGSLCRWRLASASSSADLLCEGAVPACGARAMALAPDGRHALLPGGGMTGHGARVVDTAAASAASCVLDWADAATPRRGAVCALGWGGGGACFATGDVSGGVLLWGSDAAQRAEHLAAEAALA